MAKRKRHWQETMRRLTGRDEIYGRVSTCEQVKALLKAREAWKRKKELNFDAWLIVAEGIARAREVALAEADTDKPVGRAYNEAMGAVLGKYGLDDMDRVSRMHALRVRENQKPIRHWMLKLEEVKRAKLNHPTTVLKHWEEAKDPEKALRRRLKRAQAEVQELKAALDR